MTPEFIELEDGSKWPNPEAMDELEWVCLNGSDSQVLNQRELLAAVVAGYEELIVGKQREVKSNEGAITVEINDVVKFHEEGLEYVVKRIVICRDERMVPGVSPFVEYEALPATAEVFLSEVKR